jgi:HNH endonuclease
MKEIVKTECACGCGTMINSHDNRGRRRKYVYRHQHRRQNNELFWSKVLITDGCWLWIAGKDDAGYGSLTDTTYHTRSVSAHRYAWERIYGREIPKGMCVLHECDNPACVRLDHLHIGTQCRNNQERAERHRSANGIRHPHAKLNWELVEKIRSECKLGNKSIRQIAKSYGVDHTTITKIRDRITWTYQG